MTIGTPYSHDNRDWWSGGDGYVVNTYDRLPHDLLLTPEELHDHKGAPFHSTWTVYPYSKEDKRKLSSSEPLEFENSIDLMYFLAEKVGANSILTVLLNKSIIRISRDFGFAIRELDIVLEE